MLISKSIWLECAHRMPAQGYDRLHGHSYKVTCYVKTSPVAPVLLADLDYMMREVRMRFDHCELKEGEESMEGLASAIDHWWAGRATQCNKMPLEKVVIERPSIEMRLEYVTGAA